MRPKNTPNDRGRKRRIEDAALDILLNKGIEALSARSVANHAGVQVGSVTYYFKSMSELELAISKRLAEEGMRILVTWSSSCSLETITADIARLVYDQITANRKWATASFELYVLGLRDDEFQGVSVACFNGLQDVFSRFMPQDEAQELAVYVDGFILSLLIRRSVPSVGELEKSISRVSEGIFRKTLS